jgi:hypothetical protein
LRRLAGTAGTWTTRRHAAHTAPNQVAVTCGSSRARRGGPCPDTPPGTRAAESLLRETRVQNLATLRGGARVDVSDCRVAQVLIWLSRAWPGQWASTFPWRPVRPALRSAPTRLARPSASIARPAPVPSTAAGCRCSGSCRRPIPVGEKQATARHEPKRGRRVARSMAFPQACPRPFRD